MSEEPRNNPGKSDQDAKGKKPFKGLNRGPFGWFVVALIILTVLMMMGRWQRVNQISFNPEFMDHIENSEVESIKLNPAKRIITGKLNEAGRAKHGDKAPESFQVTYDPDMIPDDFFGDAP